MRSSAGRSLAPPYKSPACAEPADKRPQRAQPRRHCPPLLPPLRYFRRVFTIRLLYQLAPPRAAIAEAAGPLRLKLTQRIQNRGPFDLFADATGAEVEAVIGARDAEQRDRLAAADQRLV